MKRLILLLSVAFAVAACNNESDKHAHDDAMHAHDDGDAHHHDDDTLTLPSTGTFGAEITAEGAKPINKVLAQLGDKDSMPVKVQGTVKAVCQMKGCWMTMPYANQDVRITFKGYKFFVPKDAAEKTAVVAGWAYKTTTSVADQKHYLEDEGASKEEIAAITQPKEEIQIIADGVIIR